MYNFIREVRTIQWTNNTGGTVASGGVVVLGKDLIGIAVDAIAALATGVLNLVDEFNLPASTVEDWAKGIQLYFNPVTAKLTKYPGPNRPKAGRATSAKVATTQTTADVAINASPDAAFDGLIAEAKSGDATLVFGSDAGKVMFVSGSSNVTISLPPVVSGSATSGMEFTIVNDGQESGAGCTVGLAVSPDSADKIVGPDVAGVANKDWLNAYTTAKPGDYLKVVSVAGVGWHVKAQRGVWTQQG